MRRFLPYAPDQGYLLPPNVNEWLSEGHFARFVLMLVTENLDLSMIRHSYEGKTGRGAPAYDPAMMIALLIYCYASGIRSSRRMEDATFDELGVRVLTGNQHPDHDSIATFRQRHRSEFQRLFRQSLELCAEAGLVKLGDIDLYLDGTKLMANASRRNTYSYDKVCKTQEQLQQLVDKIVQESEEIDASEDTLFGKGQQGGSDVPADFQDPENARKLLRQAQARLDRVRRAREEMEKAAREEAEQAVRDAEAKKEKHNEEGKRGRKPTIPDVDKLTEELCANKRVNLTDPDSQLMKDGATKAIIQAFN